MTAISAIQMWATYSPRSTSAKLAGTNNKPVENAFVLMAGIGATGWPRPLGLHSLHKELSDCDNLIARMLQARQSLHAVAPRIAQSNHLAEDPGLPAILASV